jgi:uncharacterized protein involved in exopolysaccharide biosynthesis
MTPKEVDAIERAIAAVVKSLRDEHQAQLELLRDRLTAVERDLAAYEARIGDPSAAGSNVEWLRQPKRGAR